MLTQLLSPVVEDREKIVKARALNLLALVTALAVVVYAGVTVFTSPEELPLPVLLALVVALAVCLGCFWLSRQGRVRLGGSILFVGLFAAISFYLTLPSNTISDLTMAPFLYILIVLPAGYVLHPRVSFIAATLAMLYTILVLSVFPSPTFAAHSAKANYWSNAALAFVLYYILSAVAWIFSQGINEALERTQQQNEELRKIAQEMRTQRQLQADTGKEILALAERLSEYSSRQARGSNRQAAAVAQVSSSISELEQAAREIAQSATSVDQAAQQTLKGARQGQDIVWMNSEAMAMIHSHAQRGSKEATDLHEHLKQVNRVASIISNIASQIQLVAFNATLEAAEAGEAGKRFGVVAAEVKDLAADSLTQAKQVAQIVRRVQETGEAVVTLSGEQVRAVEAGTNVMERSSAANSAIMDSATRMAGLAGQIQQATAQQQQASEQVAGSIEEIRAVVDRWVVSSYQMDELVASLQALAAQLA